MRGRLDGEGWQSRGRDLGVWPESEPTPEDNVGEGTESGTWSAVNQRLTSAVRFGQTWPVRRSAWSHGYLLRPVASPARAPLLGQRPAANTPRQTGAVGLNPIFCPSALLTPCGAVGVPDFADYILDPVGSRIPGSHASATTSNSFQADPPIASARVDDDAHMALPFKKLPGVRQLPLAPLLA